MRSDVQANPAEILFGELLVLEFAGIQVQNVIVYLVRSFDILIFNAFLNDVCDVVRQVFSESIHVLIVHEVPLEGAHDLQPLIIITLSGIRGIIGYHRFRSEAKHASRVPSKIR